MTSPSRQHGPKLLFISESNSANECLLWSLINPDTLVLVIMQSGIYKPSGYRSPVHFFLFFFWVRCESEKWVVRCAMWCMSCFFFCVASNFNTLTLSVHAGLVWCSHNPLNSDMDFRVVSMHYICNICIIYVILLHECTHVGLQFIVLFYSGEILVCTKPST